MGREQLPPDQRVVVSYNRAAHQLQRAIDKDKATEYDRGYLAGLGRAVFELTGQWPGQDPGLRSHPRRRRRTVTELDRADQEEVTT